MGEDEARLICEIMITADDRCSRCGYKLLKRFARQFPQFKAIALNVYNTEHSTLGHANDPEWDFLREPITEFY